MTSQQRNGGTGLCIVVAVLSLITAVILSATALGTASHMSEQPERPADIVAKPLFEEAPGDCDNDRATAHGDQLMVCLAESQFQGQQDAAFWTSKATERQAHTEALTGLAIVFGLLGLAFAVFAGILRAGRRPTPAAAPAGPTPTPAPAPAPAPAPGGTPTFGA